MTRYFLEKAWYLKKCLKLRYSIDFNPTKKTAFAIALIFTYWFIACAGAKYQAFIIKTERSDPTILGILGTLAHFRHFPACPG